MPAQTELSTLDGNNGFAINGTGQPDAAGWSVGGAGDVNGDGYDDLIYSSPYPPNTSDSYGPGKSYVVFGKAGAAEPLLNPTSLDGAAGFELVGVSDFDGSGWSVSGAGDFNGDGLSDVVIGTRYPQGSSPGSHVVFGTSAGYLAGVQLSGLDRTSGVGLSGDSGGWSVSDAGDVNGDGIGDVIVGSPNSSASTPTVRYYGGGYVVFGARGDAAPSIDLASLDGSDGFAIRRRFPSMALGHSVSGAGDINGDGFDDLILGAPRGGRDNPRERARGEAYVVFGAGEGFSPLLDVEDLDGTNGFIIRGAEGDYFDGESVSDAGDVNGDGFDDLIVAGFNTAYVLFGSGGGFSPSIDLGDIDGTNGFALAGVNQDRVPAINGDAMGLTVSSAGDVNGDGVDDLIVGEVDAVPSSDGPDASVFAAYVVYGRRLVPEPSAAVLVVATAVTPLARRRRGRQQRRSSSTTTIG